MRFHWAFPIYVIAPLACLALADCGSDATGTASPDGAAGSTSGIVVVNSDYSSSSVSLLDRDGNLVKDGCLYSGTGTPGLAMALSGDVVLPTQVPPGGPVVIIDRDKNNNALTWLDPLTCAPLGQLAVGTGFYSDPHDVVTISASKAYVTRYNENGAATPTPDDFDDGDDLLIVDPTKLKITGRIDLRPFAPAGVLPDADRAILVEGKVFVSLNAISLDYSTYGTGRILIVDPVADQVLGAIDLPGAKNCGAMTYLPTDRKLLVACNGAYSDGAQQAQSSAIVAVDLGVSPPAVVAQIAAATVGGLPFTNTTVAALDGNSAIGVALGTPPPPPYVPPDRLWFLPLDGSLPVRIYESPESFTLGAVLADPAKSRVLVVDGTTNTPAFLRFFDFSSGAFTAGKTVKSNPSQKLPPRALAWY